MRDQRESLVAAVFSRGLATQRVRPSECHQAVLTSLDSGLGRFDEIHCPRGSMKFSPKSTLATSFLSSWTWLGAPGVFSLATSESLLLAVEPKYSLC